MKEILDLLERNYHNAEQVLSMIYAKGDYSEKGNYEWNLALKMRDLAYDAYKTALFYRGEV